jgi:hypothetical protein
MTATVDLERLKAVVCRLVDELALQIGGNEFKLPEDDFYWKIDPQVQRNMSVAPLVMHVGRLRDDWDLTKRLADAPDRIGAYPLTEVAELLAFLGEASVGLPWRTREQEKP